MTKNNSEKSDKIDKSLADILKSRRKEWRFHLSLPALIKGNLPKGKKFEEKTILKNISSGGAYFSLDSGVTIGSKLNLVIDIPNNLTEGKKITLQLGGLTVRLKKPTSTDKKQEIALCFNEDFQFITKTEEKKKNSS
ncbi:unnamed protein product [marine sediment metagenome]|uniref:PilZ domain-containing protein n=1 Tax=marine sediment metagenome TaxID=412755 RepID=X1BGP1_9ZZZZ